ncbi:hypothetical protein [Streptomyces sp. NPDC003077]|uniref:hypothetical protein n=1 Tax=Streptomyces sp. NPDC003077 TaxID=3154443 RepID=UPI0033A185E0
MTARAPRRTLGKRTVGAVLAAAVAVGALLCVVVLRLGQGDSAAPPRQSAPPRPHALPRDVAGERVTSVAAGNGGVVYGTEAGSVFVTPAHDGPNDGPNDGLNDRTHDDQYDRTHDAPRDRPRRITGVDGRVVNLAFDPTGRWLAVAGARDELAVVDTAHPTSPVIRRRTRTISSLAQGIVMPDRLAVDPSGSRVAAQTDGIGVYDLRGSRPPRWLDLSYECSSAHDMAFVGTEFVAASGTCAHVWDAATLRMRRQVVFPGTGFAAIGHDRILYGTFRHARLLDYHATSPLPSASAAPGEPRPVLGDIIADKTIGNRRSPIRPVADDGRVVAVLQDTRLIFWEPATRRTLTAVTLPFPAICPSSAKPKIPAQFTTSFSADHKTLVISGFCPPYNNIESNSEEGRRLSTYRRWAVAYPSP